MADDWREVYSNFTTFYICTGTYMRDMLPYTIYDYPCMKFWDAAPDVPDEWRNATPVRY